MSPFIVRTYDGGACHDECAHPNLDHRASGEGCLSADERWLDDRHAVETIEEAREHIVEGVGIPEPETWAELNATHASIAELPESGGTVGPLSDGTIIEVRPVTYAELRGDAGLTGVELYGLRDERRDQIIDAYNERSH